MCRAEAVAFLFASSCKSAPQSAQMPERNFRSRMERVPLEKERRHLLHVRLSRKKWSSSHSEDIASAPFMTAFTIALWTLKAICAGAIHRGLVCRQGGLMLEARHFHYPLQVVIRWLAEPGRSSEATNSGKGLSRRALIAHRASRRARPTEGLKASASASCTSAAT